MSQGQYRLISNMTENYPLSPGARSRATCLKKSWKYFIRIVSTIRIQKQITNKARPEGNRTQCWRRVKGMQLPKTISALLSVKKKEAFHLLTRPAYLYQMRQTRARTQDCLLMVDHLFRRFGAYLKSYLSYSVNTLSVSTYARLRVTELYSS